MVHNRIKVMRAEAEISATTLAEKMPDGMNKVCMSFIEKGQVLPTKEGLTTMCEVLNCRPDDLYSPDDIDLRAVGHKNADLEAPAPRPARFTVKRQEQDGIDTIKVEAGKVDDKLGHEGMEQLRVWMPADEKAALFKAVSGLGYKSVAEWLREMYRQTIHKYVSLGLKDSEKLHEVVTSHHAESNDRKLMEQS